ncbi:hypothetical protein UFOVP683_2 [uncultured Caudovirales phage]|uniref:Uncharacterized protein n=1 Tax=uncultured Caudovirales phage TaxID=2100421 RepID=A0A6J5NI06_9CAUD|nr:hypothetical protein UFOVP683_2 [uncultured Caudovirales phage]
MEKNIMYDAKQKRFFYQSTNKNYIDRKTVLKSFLGEDTVLNNPYTFDNSIGHLLDIENDLKIDYIVFKNLSLITSFRFTDDFKFIYQSFENSDIKNLFVNTILPENIYGIILIENNFKDNLLLKSNSIFIWYDHKNKKIYKPLYNNLYENGNICFGENTKIEKPFLNLAEKAKIIFQDTPTNSDLHHYNNENFIRFETEDENLKHTPVKNIKLSLIGLSDSRVKYTNSIMEGFLK